MSENKTKRALVMASLDPEIEMFRKESEDQGKTFAERSEFLFKAHKKLGKDAEEFKAEYWNRIKKALDRKGLLPEDFGDEKYRLFMDSGVIFIEEKSESNGLADMLKNFLDL